MTISPPQPLFQLGTALCENPLWDSQTKLLRWTDILRGHLYEWHWDKKIPRRIYEGVSVGGFTMQADGSLLLFREKDIAVLDGAGARSIISCADLGGERFNDVIAAPDGRVFAGTFGGTLETGGLYQIERDGSYQRIRNGSLCSNGLGFSPDLTRMYWICTTRGAVFEFPYDSKIGAIGKERVLFQNPEGSGYTDGMTVDSEGNLYIIRWGAPSEALLILSAEGKELAKYPLKASAATAPCFCGPNLKDLVITSAEDTEANGIREADLFRIEQMPIAGKNEFYSRILI